MSTENHNPRDLVIVPDTDPVSVTDGNSWKSPYFGTEESQALNGGFSLDIKVSSTSGTPVGTPVVRGGNFRRDSGDLPDLEIDAADLPSFANADLGVDRVINVENMRTRYGQVEIAIAGGNVTIDHAVLRFRA